jgi:hypothetical protein
MDIARLDLELGSHCEPGVVHSGKFGCVSTRESSHGDKRSRPGHQL